LPGQSDAADAITVTVSNLHDGFSFSGNDAYSDTVRSGPAAADRGPAGRPTPHPFSGDAVPDLTPRDAEGWTIRPTIGLRIGAAEYRRHAANGIRRHCLWATVAASVASAVAAAARNSDPDSPPCSDRRARLNAAISRV
jgi:hypothetical protein